ncbi:MAG: hypothetical protein A2W05_00945 [Candidatus Schekmanbacteria bacterium RBG_16_38_10]|uniref:Uncharacterized protein n=1 Tax=Candidatus Schekmanbacteria bacterium RBG_16_38_10 TaxID=1817879 RepID=A0A1F7S2L5_9BACT|nr:MAG: hypothetical protein A2W05_00945 [Candidatus Schekmanbacteria bacterium RBG_16_38_10]
MPWASPLSALHQFEIFKYCGKKRLYICIFLKDLSRKIFSEKHQKISYRNIFPRFIMPLGSKTLRRTF